MTNRRQFLQIGLAASTLPIAGSLLTTAPASALETAAPASQAIPLHKVVFDTQSALSRAFGDAAARTGASVHAMTGGDITDFWYHELDLLWRKEPVAIAGLTRHGPLFVLERFGWDRGLRVVFRAEHKTASPGLIEHQLTGPRLPESRATALSAAGDEWSRVMAAVVTQCIAGCTDVTEQKLVTRTSEPLPDDEALYSWVIAPRV